ncbi:MAG: pyruvate, water dikinase regulatory protein [Pseudomonadota bacterium]
MREWIRNAANSARARVRRRRPFHLHLISDSTGETLTNVSRAVASQYSAWRAVEHMTSMVRTAAQLEDALNAIHDDPGIVLFTIVDPELARMVAERCLMLGVPSVDVLTSVTQTFDAYLGETGSGEMGAQHALDDSYFRRLDAIKFAMAHDDGNLPENIEEADIVLIGISRTSKTPTSIVLAQRGVKAFNIPLVPNIDLPKAVLEAERPLVVALVASAERIRQVRENRLLAFERELEGDLYIDRGLIAEELAWTRRLCKQHGWPMIDVTKRSVEETAAAIHTLAKERGLDVFDDDVDPVEEAS